MAEDAFTENEVEGGINVVRTAVIHSLAFVQLLLVFLHALQTALVGAFRRGHEEIPPALGAEGEVIDARIIKALVFAVAGTQLGNDCGVMVKQGFGCIVRAELAVGAVVQHIGVEKNVVGAPAEGGVQFILHAGGQSVDKFFAFLFVRHAFCHGYLVGGGKACLVNKAVEFLRTPYYKENGTEKQSLNNQGFDGDDDMMSVGFEHMRPLRFRQPFAFGRGCGAVTWPARETEDILSAFCTLTSSSGIFSMPNHSNREKGQEQAGYFFRAVVELC